MIANIGKSTANSGSGVPTLEEIETTWEKIELDVALLTGQDFQDIEHEPFDHTKFLMACISEMNNEVYGVYVAPMYGDDYNGYGARMLCPAMKLVGNYDFLDITATQSGNIYIARFDFNVDESSEVTIESIRPYIYIKPQ